MSDPSPLAALIDAALTAPSWPLLAPTMLSALLLGLGGAAHCVGMCGGIVATLNRRTGRPSAGFSVVTLSARPPAPVGHPARVVDAQPAVALQWVYNLGRIGSYTLAGALAGTVGSAAWISSHLLPLQQAAFAVGSLMMILIGLHLTGLPVLAHWLERAGSRVWRLIEPAARWSLRRSGTPGALLAGAAWGWVPCGMVYSVLTAALVSGSAASGAAIMLAFGVGTLPGLTAFGWLARQSLARTRSPTLLRAAGLLIIGWGVAGLMRIDPLVHLQQFGEACASGFR